MLKNKLIIHKKSVLGIIIILLWSSFLPNLYPTPFQRKKAIKSFAKELAELPEWIKKESGDEGYTQQDYENMIINELISSWYKGVFMILIGILSGFLIIRRSPVGYILAVFCFALFLIIPRSFSFIRYGLSSHIKMLQISLTKNYSLFFSIIRDDIVLVISVIIFIYLILPSTVKKFKSINGTRKPAPDNELKTTKYEL
jgi:hypothetical protein